nr:beta-NGF-like family protein [Oriental turtle dovepox virus]
MSQDGNLTLFYSYRTPKIMYLCKSNTMMTKHVLTPVDCVYD